MVRMVASRWIWIHLYYPEFGIDSTDFGNNAAPAAAERRRGRAGSTKIDDVV